MPSPSSSPSTSLLGNLRQELQRYTPFSLMEGARVERLVAACQQAYFAPGEVLLEPGSGEVKDLYIIRQGSVTGERGLADLTGGAFSYESGDLFPISAAMAARPVTATYKATEDTFVLVLPVAAMRELAHTSAVFGDFLNRRVLKFLELSRRALQAAYSSQALAEQSLETPLGDLLRRPPVSCSPQTPLRDALALMHSQRIGSILVVNPNQEPIGILTRYDILGRVTLAAVPLTAPLSQVMVSPVHSLDASRSAQDALLLMSRYSIRHVPITRAGVLVGMVSERDLFSIQRTSIKQVGAEIRHAQDVATLQIVAGDIRRLTTTLLGQGVQAKQLSTLISHLNDLLSERLVQVLAAEHGIDLQNLCWLALGSEGRSEQTIATDQDNAIILAPGTMAEMRENVFGFARAVNTALDACGFPLCKGNIMASNPECCLTLTQWQQRFAQWMEHGAPQDLLAANIYFDFRPLAGNAALAEQLRAHITPAAQALPRFHKQLAVNALQHSPPLNWMGGLESTTVDGQETLDLKLQAGSLMVDAARVMALALGIAATNTRERLSTACHQLGVPEVERENWLGAFDFIQTLRLRAQLEPQGPWSADQPNRLNLSALNDIDRRILKEALRAVRSLQQRLALDYER
jgi:CBS domain-containing protein